MKRICFIADAASPHTKKWIEQCRELHYELFIISHRYAEIPGVTVIQHPLSLVGFPRYAVAVRRLIRALKPDLIHAHQFGAHGLYALFANCAPVIISAWGSDILVNAKRSRCLRALIRWEIKKAALVTGVNWYLCENLIYLGAPKDKVLTVPIGIDQALYDRLSHWNKDESSFIICSPRLHEPLYHQREIIESFAALAADYPQIKLWILGEGSLTPALQEYVRERHLEERVRFWGMVTPEQVGECLAKSQVIVSIPSSDALPVSVLTGMAAGCLPVLSNLPTFRGLVTHGVNGLMIDVDDFQSLPDVLRRAIEDKQLRTEAAAQNRNIVAKQAIMEKQFPVMLNRYRSLTKTLTVLVLMISTVFSQEILAQMIDWMSDVIPFFS